MEPYDDLLIDFGLVGGGADTGDVGDGRCVGDVGCGDIGNGRCCVGGAGAGRLVDSACLGTTNTETKAIFLQWCTF